MASLSLVRARIGAATGLDLPSPPTDEEKYWYMGRQHRWLLAVQSISFALIGVSVVRFSLSDAHLILLLAPFSLFTVALIVGLATSTRGKVIDRVDHELRVLEYAPNSYPTVDVFLPSAGEPLEVLANTYRHVANLSWPAEVTVYALDDSGRETVRELAEEYGFTYGSRPNRGYFKKAGNLLYGYEQSRGDLIAIFDADFVPRPDFLSELVPYFEEEDVAIVQSPQFFDSRKGMHWLQRCAGATQELFYRMIQPARDRVGAAICVGTCALYRRSALEEVGGFAQIGHSEDVHTGVKLMKVGYRLRYVPILVSKGMCPDTVVAFVTQQYRWCTGSMSLLTDSAFHNAEHITPRQRLCFWSGFLYYITTAVNVFTTPLPVLAMVWLLPTYVFPANSIWLLGALVMWLIVLPIMSKSRWRLDVLRVQNLYSFAHAVAIWHALRGRTQDWVATGAAGGAATTPTGVTVLRVAKTWIVLTQSAVWVGLAINMHKYGVTRFWAMAAFASAAGYVQLPVLAIRTKPKSALSTLIPRARSAAGAAAVRERHIPRLSQLRERFRGAHPPAVLRDFRPDIQGLRAIAVTLVVLYHAHVPGIRGGYVGVDVFFVISGFLITGGLLRQVATHGKLSFRNFYAGRFRRLALPAAVVLVVTVVATRAWDSIFQVRTVTNDAMYAAIYGINYHLANNGVNYQRASGPESPLQHYWSLAVEEQFYVIWPVLIMACVWLFRRHYKGAVLVAIGTGSVVSLWLCIHLTTTDQPMAYFSIQSRAWELGLGAILASVATKLTRMPGWFAAALSWLGLAGIVATGIGYTNATVFPGKAAILPVVAAAAVIAAGCRPSRGSAEMLLNRRPIQGIGKVSYSWYLWHWPLLIILPMRLGFDLSWPGQLEIAILALWLATLSYYLLESPTRRSRMRRPVWLSVGPGTAGVSLGCAVIIAATVPALVGSGKPVTLAAAASTASIEHSVAAGTLTVAAPRNLTPTLAAIKRDQPASTRNGCHANFLVVRQGACVYGDPAGTHTMVLFGDSHSQQWLPALDVEAKKLHWKVIAWTKSACPIADLTVHAVQLGNRLFTECKEWRDITLGRIEKAKPDLVLVSQSDSVPAHQYDNTQWSDATVRTLLKLRQAGTPVIYLLDTPLPTKVVPDCVANNLTKVQPCVYKRSSAFAAFPGRHQRMADTLKVASITAVDPTNWFCTATKCPPIVGNILVYRDESHMSTPYSTYLAPAMAALFVPRKA